MTTDTTTIECTEPPNPCTLCPRLHSFIEAQKQAHPDWHNAPVPSFGVPSARLLIVGLAPGLRGANRTGRAFTGDWAGDLLYDTLTRFGFATGRYQANPDDGLTLHDTRITNAVRCVPPQNKPVGAEIATCNQFLAATIAQNAHCEVILALGRIAHDAILRAIAEKRSAYPFSHNARHRIPGKPTLIDSYHCSRYNTNTGRLTPDMFDAVFRSIATELGAN